MGGKKVWNIIDPQVTIEIIDEQKG